MTREVTAAVPATVNDTRSILAVVERVAMSPDVDVDKIERLLQMQERMLTRSAEMAFNAALAQMQNELPVITETGNIRDKAGRVQSTYAKFEDINEACKPILKEHGFAMSFRTAFDSGEVIVTGVLSHEQGHRETSTIRLPADVTGNKNSVQAWGSSIAYGKRYTMNALLNITSRGEDNDGQGSGSSASTDGREPMQAPRAAHGRDIVTDSQVRLLRAKLSDAGMSAEQVCTRFGVDSIIRLPFSKMNDALAFIADPDRDVIEGQRGND